MSASSFSVIVPALDEEHYLPACLAAVRRSLPSAEVIVVDGGSADRTRELAREHGAHLLLAPASRGGQCRLGATHASGDVLCFLHADTVIADGAEARLRAFFAEPRHEIATLRVRYPPTRTLHRIVGWGSRFDSFLTSTGDQGILVRRELYEALGGIPDQPLFEDVEFFRRARARARVRSIDVGLHVSMRRFSARGLLPQLAYNVYLSALYALGTPADELARRYRASEKV